MNFFNGAALCTEHLLDLFFESTHMWEIVGLFANGILLETIHIWPPKCGLNLQSNGSLGTQIASMSHMHACLEEILVFMN